MVALPSYRNHRCHPRSVQHLPSSCLRIRRHRISCHIGLLRRIYQPSLQNHLLLLPRLPSELIIMGTSRFRTGSVRGIRLLSFRRLLRSTSLRLHRDRVARESRLLHRFIIITTMNNPESRESHLQSRDFILSSRISPIQFCWRSCCAT